MLSWQGHCLLLSYANIKVPNNFITKFLGVFLYKHQDEPGTIQRISRRNFHEIQDGIVFAAALKLCGFTFICKCAIISVGLYFMYFISSYYF